MFNLGIHCKQPPLSLPPSLSTAHKPPKLQPQQQGHHEMDVAATNMMNKPDGPWIQFGLTAQSVVGMECGGPPAVALPSIQQSLELFLAQLEQAGHVSVQVYKHKCQRVPGQTGKYTVEVQTPALIHVKPADSSVVFNADNVCRFVNVSGLRSAGHFQVNWQLVYIPSEQRTVKPDWPRLFFKANTRLAPKQVVRLAPAAAPPIAPAVAA